MLNFILKISDTIIGGLLRNIPGGIGQRLRFIYWQRRFKRCGRIKIDEGVIFNYPEQMEFGEDVWIMPYSILVAPAPTSKSKHSKTQTLGLKIGNQVQIGAFNLINATGGMSIGNYVTFSARVSIYSATHLPQDPEDLTKHVGSNGMIKDLPVFSESKELYIGDGAWLGLHSAVICADIGEHSFVTSGCIVSKDLPSFMQLSRSGKVKPRYDQELAK